MPASYGASDADHRDTGKPRHRRACADLTRTAMRKPWQYLGCATQLDRGDRALATTLIRPPWPPMFQARAAATSDADIAMPTGDPLRSSPAGR